MSKRDDVREIVQYIMTREGIVNKQVRDYVWLATCKLKDVEDSILKIEITNEEADGACCIEIGTIIPCDSPKVNFVWCDKLNRRYQWGKFITINDNNKKQVYVMGRTFIYETFKDIDGCRDKFLNIFYLIGGLTDVVYKQLKIMDVLTDVCVK